MAEIKLTQENFENEVLKSEIPVMIDFWASWCSPCRMVAPIVEEIADEYKGKIKVGKVNVDEEQSLAAAFRITSIPTIVLMENGKPIKQSVGYSPKEELIHRLGL